VQGLIETAAEFYRRLETCFLEFIARENPTVLGLSVYSGTLPASLFIFKRVKEIHPHIRTVMGGGIFADQLQIDSPNFAAFLENAPYVDQVVVGEGELVFLELLRGKLPGSRRVFTRADVGGQTLDLGSVEIPDFSDFDLDSYPNLASYVSRSCPFQCTFCSETVQWGKYRKKSAAQVAAEFETLHRRHGAQLFLLGDSLLNPIAAELAEQLTRSPFTVYWDGYLRADKPVCNRDNTLLWRRGGFYRARLGLESGSPRVLEAMGKRITPAQIRDALSALAYAGIKTTTYWVIGHPGESEADFQQTLDLVGELRSDIYEAECNPFHYHLTGQVESRQWAKNYKPVPLYPRDALDMLVVQTWRMDCQPSREETYRRVSRFVRHCKKLGIPNPYSMQEIHQADKRWKKLHKNAVPALVDFKKDAGYIDEAKQVSELAHVKNTYRDREEDWDF
jgi:radical SAM superfamily enzyme YgiQ (UPF0313 family)